MSFTGAIITKSKKKGLIMKILLLMITVVFSLYGDYLKDYEKKHKEYCAGLVYDITTLQINKYMIIGDNLYNMAVGYAVARYGRSGSYEKGSAIRKIACEYVINENDHPYMIQGMPFDDIYMAGMIFSDDILRQ